MANRTSKTTENTTAIPPRNRREIGGLGDVLFTFPPAVKFEVMNDTVSLVVTDAKTVTASNFDDNGKRTGTRRFASGDVVRELAIIGEDVTTGQSVTLYVRGRAMRSALTNALAEAGVRGIAPGDRLDMTYIGDEPVYDNDGNELENARKLYSCVIDAS